MPGDKTQAGRGTTRAEDVQGTPTQSHILSSILVYEDRRERVWDLVNLLGNGHTIQKSLTVNPSE